METLKIIGLEEEHNKGIFNKINANPFEKRIEILGWKFIEEDLEKLSNWVDEYLHEKRGAITLKFLNLHTAPPTWGTSFRYLDYFNFPFLKTKWNEKVKDPYKPKPSILRNILSKFSEFSFIIEGDDDHPELCANYETGFAEINGRILPDETFYYFFPLLAWIDNYLEDNNHKIVLKTKLEFIGDEAKEILLEIFRMLKSKSDTSEIIWYYPDDDDSIEKEGYGYRETCKLGDRMKFGSYEIE